MMRESTRDLSLRNLSSPVQVIQQVGHLHE
jgi:hypothetical protein